MQDAPINVMACISPSPSSGRVIHAAARMAALSGSTPIALYVGSQEKNARHDAQLEENIRTARRLGFDVHTIESGNIALTIAEYAKRAKITDLFLGYSAPGGIFDDGRSITDKLTEQLPGTVLHVVPDSMSSALPQLRDKEKTLSFNVREFLRVLLIMAGATMLSVWFDQSTFSNANIITIYILAVLIASITTSHRIYGILASVLYILLFNFLFITPRYTLLVYDPRYLMTYFVSVIAALITSSLAIRLKKAARVSAENAWQAKILLDTSNQLERAAGTEEIVQVTCRMLSSLLNRTILYYGPENKTGTPDFCFASPDAGEMPDYGEEHEAAAWTLRNHHHCGAFTAHFPESRCQFFSLHTGSTAYGVIGIDMGGKRLKGYENSIILSILRECTMTLENEAMRKARQEAEHSAAQERLRADLLRSISHDLRTPLTSIYGNAATLQANMRHLTEEEKEEICGDLMEDSAWLKSQMENILSLTRLESSGGIERTTENMEDVIHESVKHLPAHPDHTIHVEPAGELCFAEMDAGLIAQVLINLIGNALRYTPPGSEIWIRTEKKGGDIITSIEDNGPGIADEDKEHIFELFYTGKNTPADGSRRMGVGLHLCSMILHEHGGSIEVSDRAPCGTVFRFTLPAKEVPDDAADENPGR